MRNLFLFGDVSYNFQSNVEKFVRQCGGEPKIAVLMMNKASEKYEQMYRVPILNSQVKEVKFIYPEEETLKEEDIKYLSCISNGILMAGGDPEQYSKVYCKPALKSILKAQYYKGIPYAGVSAGAILAMKEYVESGQRLVEQDNVSFLVSKFNDQVKKEMEDKKVEGIGMLTDVLLEPHFSEWGLFPAFLEKMRNSEVKFGIGFDESIAIQITNETDGQIYGKGKVYMIQKEKDFIVSIKQPKERFKLAKEKEMER